MKLGHILTISHSQLRHRLSYCHLTWQDLFYVATFLQRSDLLTTVSMFFMKPMGPSVHSSLIIAAGAKPPGSI